jgi:hypothetical protein
MADVTLEQILGITRDNLKAMAQIALPESVKTLPYVEVQGDTDPQSDFVVTGTNYRRQTEAMQLFTFNIRMRVTVDKVLAGFEGNRQELAYFVYLPRLLQYYAQHPSLAYRNNVGVIVTAPPGVDDENTAITSSGVDISTGKIIITLNWNILYRTSFPNLC